jgi:hypothetical protein
MVAMKTFHEGPGLLKYRICHSQSMEVVKRSVLNVSQGLYCPQANFMGFSPRLLAFAAYESSCMKFEGYMIAHRRLFTEEAQVKIRGIACKGQKQGLKKNCGLSWVEALIEGVKVPSKKFEKIFLGIILLCPEIYQFAA